MVTWFSLFRAAVTLSLNQRSRLHTKFNLAACAQLVGTLSGISLSELLRRAASPSLRSTGDRMKTITRRTSVIIASLVAIALGSLAQAITPQQYATMLLTGVGGGGGGAYSGPVDINGAAYALWSTRCQSTANTGNVADVWDAATGSTPNTLITCSAGGILNTNSPTALATTCS